MNIWIRHDVAASTDPAVLNLRAEFGLEGYGAYWATVELLARSKRNELLWSRLPAYALGLGIDVERLRSILDFAVSEELFSSDGERLWSDRLLREIEYAGWRSERGRKAAAARWNTDGDANSKANSSAPRNALNRPTDLPTEEEKTVGKSRPSGRSITAGPAPVPREIARRYFENRGVPASQADRWWDYWDDRDWIAEDRTGKPKVITPGTWRRRAGYWIGRYRRDLEVERSEKRSPKTLTYSEAMEDWRKRFGAAGQFSAYYEQTNPGEKPPTFRAKR